MLQLFKGITSEADTLLHDLQDSLHSQEKKLTSYAQQQREVGILLTLFQCSLSYMVSFHKRKVIDCLTYDIQAHSRAVETTRSISQITVNFFKTLDGHASMLGQIVEEAQTCNDQKLSELEKKFEVTKVFIEHDGLTEVICKLFLRRNLISL